MSSVHELGIRTGTMDELRELLAANLVSNRHQATPAGEATKCKTCGHGINLAQRKDGSAYWRHNPKTFSRAEVPESQQA